MVVSATPAKYPTRWALAFLFVLMLTPGLDLPVSMAFYQHDTPFKWTVSAFPDFLRRTLPEAIVASVVVCLILWVGARFVRAWPHEGTRQWIGTWMTGPRVTYLVTTLLIGPGLIVETLLKPNWGRARPKDITAFGGDAAYTLPWVPAHECVGNCSFASGHAAVAFWVTAYVFLLPAQWRARAMLAAMVFGLLMGLLRIAQGGHFLSDVAAAGFIVVLVNALLARVFLKPTT